VAEYFDGVDADIWVLQSGTADFFHSFSLLPTDLRGELADTAGIENTTLWGPNIRPWWLTRDNAGRCWSAMSRVLYRLIAALARFVVRTGRSKDLEIIVLRHQLTVLHRKLDRPELCDDDRSLLGAIAAALPRSRRHGWVVTPDTLQRWHRQRVARQWTQSGGP
jgi:hypothetical protein